MAKLGEALGKSTGGQNADDMSHYPLQTSLSGTLF